MNRKISQTAALAACSVSIDLPGRRDFRYRGTNRRWLSLLSISGFLFLHSLAAYAGTGMEATIAYVNLYGDPAGSPPRCCSSCDDVSWGDNFAGVFAGKLTDLEYDSIITPSNAGVDHDEWADKETNSHGTDHLSPYGVDTTDVFFIYAHGATDNEGGAYFSRFWAGDPSPENACEIRYGESGSFPDVYWGDGDLEYGFMKSCQSLQRETFLQDAYDSLTIGQSQFKLLAGWHGNTYDSMFDYLAFTFWLQGVDYNGIGEDWVLELSDINPDEADNCATVVVHAANEADADHILYYGGLLDYQHGYGGNGFSKLYYAEGCDPAGGNPLPD